MAYLTDVYNAISAQDQELEKEAAEIMKVAEEHDAAGRIMARGFADELNKIAGYDAAASEAAFDQSRRPARTRAFGAKPLGGNAELSGRTSMSPPMPKKPQFDAGASARAFDASKAQKPMTGGVAKPHAMASVTDARRGNRGSAPRFAGGPR